MTVRVYRSTDVGAPSLTITTGSLINVLDACLVTGYGSQAPAGWTKEYSGTNKAVYKQGALATYNQYHLWVDNTITSGYALVRGYETMSDVDTGTNVFPNPRQLSQGGVAWSISNSGTIPRPWMIVATERTIYYWNMYSNDTPPAGQSYWFAFGDFNSAYGTADKYNCMLIGSQTTSMTSASHMNMTTFSVGVSSGVGRYLARSRDGIYTSPPCSMVTDFRHLFSGANSMQSYLLTPNPTDHKLFTYPITLNEPVQSITYSGSRGTLPGLLAVANGVLTVSDAYFQPDKQIILHGDQITFPQLPGKIYQAISSRSTTIATSYQSWLIEISDTW